MGGGLALVFLVLAIAALVPVRTRIPVLTCWTIAATSALASAVLSAIPVSIPAGTTHMSLALLLLTFHGSLLVAVSLGAQGALAEGLHARKWAAGALMVVGAIPVVAGVGWSLVSAGDHLSHHASDDIPDYMLGLSRSQSQGILVLRGSSATGITYAIVRPDGVTEGQQALLALTPERKDVTATVTDLITRPTQETAAALIKDGVSYVVMPPHTDPSVASVLDTAGGLSVASTPPNVPMRAWSTCVNPPRCDAPPPMPAGLYGSISWMRIVLLVLQGLALFGVVVMALPRDWGTGRG
jgi:hypothetical protein